MSGSNGRCCKSEPDQPPGRLVEEDGFITIIATGWRRPDAGARALETDPDPAAPPDPD